MICLGDRNKACILARQDSLSQCSCLNPEREEMDSKVHMHVYGVMVYSCRPEVTYLLGGRSTESESHFWAPRVVEELSGC